MRSRNLKPGFFRNEQLGNLPFEARILFEGLWCLSDREGFFENRPNRIAAEIFPYDKKIDGRRIESMLNKLKEANLITLCMSHGYIPSFLEHNNPHPHEAKSTVSDELKKTLINQCNDKPLNDTAKPLQAGLNPESLLLNPESKTICPSKPTRTDDKVFFQGQKLKVDIKSHEAFVSAYPGMDIIAEYKKMDTWLIANPNRDKKNYARFANNWLGRASPVVSGTNTDSEKEARFLRDKQREEEERKRKQQEREEQERSQQEYLKRREALGKKDGIPCS
jgi:hypothetical protein